MQGEAPIPTRSLGEEILCPDTLCSHLQKEVAGPHPPAVPSHRPRFWTGGAVTLLGSGHVGSV